MILADLLALGLKQSKSETELLGKPAFFWICSEEACEITGLYTRLRVIQETDYRFLVEICQVKNERSHKGWSKSLKFYPQTVRQLQALAKGMGLDLNEHADLIGDQF